MSRYSGIMLFAGMLGAIMMMALLPEGRLKGERPRDESTRQVADEASAPWTRLAVQQPTQDHLAEPTVNPDEVVVRCVNAQTGDPVSGVRADLRGNTATRLSDAEGHVFLPEDPDMVYLTLQHPQFRPKFVTLATPEIGVREVALHPLEKKDFITLEGLVSCDEPLVEPPVLRVALPVVMRQGEHIEEGNTTERGFALIRNERCPLQMVGDGRWRFSVRISVHYPQTVHVQARVPPRDSNGTYVGDVVFVAFSVLHPRDLQAERKKSETLGREFRLERSSLVIALDVGDESGRPLTEADRWVTSLAHDALLPPGLNINVSVTPVGNSVEVFGLLAATCILVMAPGYKPEVYPRGRRSFSDKVHAPACLSVRLKRDPNSVDDAVVETVVESHGNLEPELLIVDSRRGRSSQRSFKRESGDLWTIQMRFNSGGPLHLYALLPKQTIVVPPLHLQRGTNRIDLGHPGGETVRGVVLQRGKPVREASVKWMRDGFPIRGVDTDAEGRFAIPAVLGFPATFEVVDISLCEWKTFIITKPGSVTLEMTKP